MFYKEFSMSTFKFPKGSTLNAIFAAINSGVATPADALAFLAERAADQSTGAGRRAAKAIERIKDGTFRGYEVAPSKAAAFARSAPVAAPAAAPKAPKAPKATKAPKAPTVRSRLLAIEGTLVQQNAALSKICEKLGL